MNIFERDPSTAVEPSLAQSQTAGFPVGGEGLAVDLADTLVTVTVPATDLLGSQDDSDRFWSLHAGALPQGWAFPSLATTRRLRDAIRTVLDGAQRGTFADGSALIDINALSTAVPVSRLITTRGATATVLERWHASDPALLPLAAAARSAIDLLGDTENRAHLRRCASPACSMLYVKGDARRRWCTPNICGNRDRAARHYRRRRGDLPSD